MCNFAVKSAKMAASVLQDSAVIRPNTPHIMPRGRNRELISTRDLKMFERYYYWTEVRRLRFDDTIKKLSEEEFFVSESRVIQIIRRMIRDGATVDGKCIERPLFTGFKVATKVSLPKPKPCVERQLSLFPELCP